MSVQQSSGLLCDYLAASAAAGPDRLAVEEGQGDAITYGELDVLSGRVQRRLRQMGIRRGDRVGLQLRKSIDSVAALFGILKSGAAYVPVDPNSPAERNAFIFSDCCVEVIFVEAQFENALRQELEKLGKVPELIVLDGVGGGRSLSQALPADSNAAAADDIAVDAAPSDLAFILYTSGSTGKPKGVMLSHGNARSFVDWCSEVFSPTSEDRFSSHAPFHFDLSVLDLYLTVKHGAKVVLIGEDLGKNPAGMAALIEQKRLTIWYSTPSALTLLLQFGKLGKRDLSSLRILLFAGEVFPVKHLRELKQLVPHPRYFNLYGPTETNVCTYHEIPEVIPDTRVRPYPIGGVCSHLKARVVDEAGADVPAGAEGELCIAGPAVLRGYWNLAERTARAFFGRGSERWYRTGDLVVEGEDGVFELVGRRDRMVKRRGYRIELGEIESALYRHPDVSEAATIAIADDSGVRIKAFYSTRDGKSLSMIDLKQFCAGSLPQYMIPDQFSVVPTLPKTTTDKVDYQRLKGLA